MFPALRSRVDDAEGPFMRGDQVTDGVQSPRLDAAKIEPAYKQVADQLRRSIVTGQLGYGTRLPREEELIELFGVSRPTLREALRVLASQNLIRTTRGATGGTWVARPDLGEIAGYLEMSIGLLTGGDDVSVSELVEFRALLEVPAAGLAAERRSEQDLELLRASLTRDRARVAGTSAYPGHRLFHQQIMSATQNGPLKMVADPMVNTLRTLRMREAAPPRFWEILAEEHQRIYEMIVKQDSAGARLEMQRHLDTLASFEITLSSGSTSPVTENQ